MTKIEWTEKTWNPVVGCSIVSPGCTNCYAMKMAGRLEAIARADNAKRTDPHHGGKIFSTPLAHYIGTTKPSRAGAVWTGKLALASDDTMTAPLRRRKPTMYFVNSMSDLFHEDVPDEWIDRVFAVMALTPQDTYQVLTKRSARMRDYCNDPMTPHRIAKAADALQSDFRKVTEEIRPIYGFDGYFVSNTGNVLTDTGSGTCVHCGTAVVGKEATARYCGKRCRQNAQYRMRKGKPMLHPATPSVMSPDAGEDGHQRVMLYRDGKTHRELVHRLVLAAFDRAPIADEQGRHIDGNPRNNAISNLAWGRQTENWDDSKRHGHYRRYSKLTPDDVKVIKTLAASGSTHEDLGRRFQVSATQIGNIVKGKQWATPSPLSWPLHNCWKGISAERQQEADARIPDLLATPAAVRFVSAEPLLSDINFQVPHRQIEGNITINVNALTGEDGTGKQRGKLDWVIVGGESGPNARPMHPEWARSIRDQCASAEVAFFFKQWGEFEPLGSWKEGERHFSAWRGALTDRHVIAHEHAFLRAGKARAGRLLDGREHNDMPSATTKISEVAA